MVDPATREDRGPGRPGGVVLALALATLLASGGCATSNRTLGAPGAAGGGDAERMESLLRVGDFVLQRGELPVAIAFYQQAAQMAPDQALPLVRLGGALHDAGAHDEAAGAFRAALEADPNDRAARLGLAASEVARGDAQAAIDVLDGFPPGGDDRAVAKVLGAAYDMLGRHGEAQRTYREGLASEPRDLDLRSNLALSLALTGGDAEAIALIEDVVSRPDANIRHRRNLVLILALTNAVGEAERRGRALLGDAATRAVLEQAAIARQSPDSALRARSVGAASS